MKVLLFVLSLAVFTQGTNLIGVEGSFVTISGIIELLLEGLRDFYGTAVNDVTALLFNLDSAISNLANSVIGTVFDMIDEFLSSVESLLAEARDSAKVLGSCISRARDLELLKSKVSEDVEKCRKNLRAEMASVSKDLKEEQDRGKGVISSLTESLQNCLEGSFAASCISKAQQSSLQEIQEIVTKAESLRQRVSLASDEVANCLNDVEGNGRQLANQIYQDIQQCISQAPIHTE